MSHTVPMGRSAGVREAEQAARALYAEMLRCLPNARHQVTGEKVGLRVKRRPRRRYAACQSRWLENLQSGAQVSWPWGVSDTLEAPTANPEANPREMTLSVRRPRP